MQRAAYIEAVMEGVAHAQAVHIALNLGSGGRPPEVKPVEEMDKKELISVLQAAGAKVDGRWSLTRLRQIAQDIFA